MDNNPHLRVPALRSKKNGRSAHLERFVKLIMNRFTSSGTEADDLEDGDLFIINDCGRPGNRPCFLSAFINSQGGVITRKTHRELRVHALFA